MQDVINSYVVIGKSMEEVLCIYYTTEMLHMIETLHDVGLIHGDFKPDNLLVRYARYFSFCYSSCFCLLLLQISFLCNHNSTNT